MKKRQTVEGKLETPRISFTRKSKRRIQKSIIKKTTELKLCCVNDEYITDKIK
jgi:hypothetical protein